MDMPLSFKTDLSKVENVQGRMTKLIPQIRDLEYPERRGDMIEV